MALWDQDFLWKKQEAEPSDILVDLEEFSVLS